MDPGLWGILLELLLDVDEGAEALDLVIEEGFKEGEVRRGDLDVEGGVGGRWGGEDGCGGLHEGVGVGEEGECVASVAG